MAREVKINLDVLNSTKKVYDDAISSLTNAMTQLDTTIDELRRSAWKTTGAEEFFRKYDDSWRVELGKHISYLGHLNSCLEKAKVSYTAKYDEKF